MSDKKYCYTVDRYNGRVRRREYFRKTDKSVWFASTAHYAKAGMRRESISTGYCTYYFDLSEVCRSIRLKCEGIIESVPTTIAKAEARRDEAQVLLNAVNHKDWEATVLKGFGAPQ